MICSWMLQRSKLKQYHWFWHYVVLRYRCKIIASLTAGGNIEFVIHAILNKTDDRLFCHNKTTDIVMALTNTLTTDPSYPSSYQYIVGGSEAPRAEAQSSTTPPTNSTIPTSGSSLLSSVSLLFIVMIAVVIFLFF